MDKRVSFRWLWEFRTKCNFIKRWKGQSTHMRYKNSGPTVARARETKDSQFWLKLKRLRPGTGVTAAHPSQNIPQLWHQTLSLLTQTPWSPPARISSLSNKWEISLLSNNRNPQNEITDPLSQIKWLAIGTKIFLVLLILDPIRVTRLL